MSFGQNLINALMSKKFDGCVQIDETYDVESYEASLTAIFLDGTYQNCAVSANSGEGWVRRCILKQGIKHGGILQAADVEWNEEEEEPIYEVAHGNVQILCCSSSVLQLIQCLVRDQKGR